MVGQVLGEVGTLPDIYVELEIYFLSRRLLEVRTEGNKKGAKVPFCARREVGPSDWGIPRGGLKWE